MGVGNDERTRGSTCRSSERGTVRQTYGGCGGFRVGRQRAAGVTAAGPVLGERRVRVRAQGKRPHPNPGVRKYAADLEKTRYADFGPTLAIEALVERHAIQVGRGTLRRWMMAEGGWLSRKQHKTFHQPSLRRESYGELVQIDGSEHGGFEGRAEPCPLLVFVDDPTSKLMHLRFVPSESMESHCAAIRDYLHEHRCPVAFYSNRHSAFRVVRQGTKGGQGMTQFGYALSELNIEVLCANFNRAKAVCGVDEAQWKEGIIRRRSLRRNWKMLDR